LWPLGGRPRAWGTMTSYEAGGSAFNSDLSWLSVYLSRFFGYFAKLGPVCVCILLTLSYPRVGTPTESRMDDLCLAKGLGYSPKSIEFVI